MASITPFNPGPLRRERTIGVVAERAIDLSVRDLAYGPRDSLCEHVVDLAELVGGFDVLEQLDDVPLPDEPFDWARAGLAHRALITGALEIADAGCDALFDAEIRTVARRVLARAVAAQASPLKDGAEPARIGAAAVWVAAKGNNRLGRVSGVYAKHLWAHFGVRDSSAIGRELKQAAVPDRNIYTHHYWIDSRVEWLCDVTLLTGAMRGAILHRLDEVLDTAARDAGERITLSRYGGMGRDGWERIRALRYRVRRVVKAADAERHAYVVIELGEGHAARVVALQRRDALELRTMLDEALALPRPEDRYDPDRFDEYDPYSWPPA
jgi:hypothetical protein